MKLDESYSTVRFGRIEHLTDPTTYKGQTCQGLAKIIHAHVGDVVVGMKIVSQNQILAAVHEWLRRHPLPPCYSSDGSVSYLYSTGWLGGVDCGCAGGNLKDRGSADRRARELWGDRPMPKPIIDQPSA